MAELPPRHSIQTSGGPRVYCTVDYVVLEDGEGKYFRLRLERARDPRWLLAWLRRLCDNADISRHTVARIISVAENATGQKLPGKSMPGGGPYDD